MSSREMVKVGKNDLKGKLEPELARIRKNSWEHSRKSEHFDAQTYEFPNTPIGIKDTNRGGKERRKPSGTMSNFPIEE